MLPNNCLNKYMWMHNSQKLCLFNATYHCTNTVHVFLCRYVVKVPVIAGVIRKYNTTNQLITLFLWWTECGNKVIQMCLCMYLGLCTSDGERHWLNRWDVDGAQNALHQQWCGCEDVMSSVHNAAESWHCWTSSSYQPERKKNTWLSKAFLQLF